MKNNMVSVVITSYKREEQYVREAIESVVNQSYKNIEIILIDDNGDNSDYSNKLEKLCNEEGVRYIKNVHNSGAQYSRNVGILRSQGEYVAFLDDDDVWMSDKIEKQLKLFSDSDVGMVYCDGYSFEDGNQNKKWEFREASIYNRPISLNLELFNDYIGSTSQALIKKECFAKAGLFDCDMPARQDYEMWLRLCKYYKVVGSSERLLLYRFHPGERISTNWKKCLKSYELVLQKHREEYQANKYAKAKIILRMFDWSLRGKKYFLAARYFLYAIFTQPKCVIDVIRRRISKQGFSEFYTDNYLNSIGLMN